MTHFIRDNTELPAEKTDFEVTNVPEDQKVTADDWNKHRQALLDTQEYLNTGVFDASSGLTVGDIDLINDQSPSVGPELDWKGQNSRFLIGIDVANAPTSRDFVLTGVRGTYSFPDGVTTNGSPTLTSASGGGFKSAIIGAGISGAGIPVGATVSAVASATSLTMSANATATATGVRVTITRNTVEDLAYWKHRGALTPTLGIGVTPPDGAARLQVSAPDGEAAMGTVRLRRSSSQTAKVLTVHDSAPVDRWWIDNDYYMSGFNPTTQCAVAIQAHSDANGRSLCLTSNDKATVYGFSLPTGAGNLLRFSCVSGGPNIADFGTDGSTRILGTFRTSGAVRFDSEVAPPSLSANQNDFNPTNLSTASVLMLTASVPVDLTGLVSSSVSGRTLWLYNVGANNITLKHQSASSTAANRFIGRGGADTVLTPNTAVQLWFSASQTRWVILSDTL